MPFDSSVDSLLQYRCPDWFRNAKFGIWAHWGPQAVPGVGDWYARNMYVEGHENYLHHLEHYGHPSVFGFKDILPLWKAEHFDPQGLMRRYRRAGARYFAACAVHHDNFDCWNSTHHRWNAVNMGPKKDIVKLWADAARAEGMYVAVTEHHERSYSWFNTNKGADAKGPLAGVPYDGNDPAYQDYYYEPHDDDAYVYPRAPSKEFVDGWYRRIADLIDQHHPDLLYTDGGIPFGEVGRTLLAYYYNAGLKWNDGLQNVVYAYKDVSLYPGEPHAHTHGDYYEGAGVLDVERGVVQDIHPNPWQTDTCVGNWYYNEGIRYKSADMVIHMLVDIVSKNGNLLLNFPPRADGTLDDEELAILDELGDWFEVNGEAIYDSRPWQVFGEGPTRADSGHFAENELPYVPEDFRFTRKNDAVYVAVMKWPVGGGEVGIRSLGQHPAGIRVLGASLLGGGELEVEQCDEVLTVRLPPIPPCRSVAFLKIGIS